MYAIGVAIVPLVLTSTIVGLVNTVLYRNAIDRIKREAPPKSLPENEVARLTGRGAVDQENQGWYSQGPFWPRTMR